MSISHRSLGASPVIIQSDSASPTPADDMMPAEPMLRRETPPPEPAPADSAPCRLEVAVAAVEDVKTVSGIIKKPVPKGEGTGL